MVNLKDGLSFLNTVKWEVFDKDGNLTHIHTDHNQVQHLAREYIIDWLGDSATSSASSVEYMAVGTGSAQGYEELALTTKVSSETLSGQTQPTAYSLENVASFTNITGTVFEAGLFPLVSCDDNMLFYNKTGLGVPLTSSDTLQITWTISITSS